MKNILKEPQNLATLYMPENVQYLERIHSNKRASSIVPWINSVFEV